MYLFHFWFSYLWSCHVSCQQEICFLVTSWVSIWTMRTRYLPTYLPTSVTRLGDFWKFCKKICQAYLPSKICWLFWKLWFLSKNHCSYFLGKLWGKIGLLFSISSGHTATYHHGMETDRQLSRCKEFPINWSKCREQSTYVEKRCGHGHERQMIDEVTS